MPRNKRDLEKIESFAERSEKYEGPAMEEVSAYLRGLIDSALQNPSADPQPETRSLSELMDSIESDASKSQGRKEFEIRLAQMVYRMRHRKSRSPSNDESQAEPASDEPLALYERINSCVNDRPQ